MVRSECGSRRERDKVRQGEMRRSMARRGVAWLGVYKAGAVARKEQEGREGITWYKGVEGVWLVFLAVETRLGVGAGEHCKDTPTTRYNTNSDNSNINNIHNNITSSSNATRGTSRSNIVVAEEGMEVVTSRISTGIKLMGLC